MRLKRNSFRLNMAGKRHHFIPQFLQRGFASLGDVHNAWVFHKERSAINTNIKNIAIEGQFYAHEGDTSVDDKITDVEGSLAAFVTKLCGAPDGTAVDSHKAAELINHSLVRTRHVRQNFQRTSEQLLRKTYAALMDPEKLTAVLIRHIQTDENFPNLVRKRLVLELANVVPEEQIAEAVEALLPAAIQHLAAAMPDEIRRTAPDHARALEAEAKMAFESSLLREAVKQAHLKALRLPSAPTTREDAFAELTFEVRRFAEGDIILGDSVAVYAVTGERKVTPLNDSATPMIGVLLPLDPETCLIGELGEPCESFSTAASIRRSIAECSLEFL